MAKNDLKINSKYDEYIDEKALRRQGRKKSKMPVKSAFLKQISKIQKERFEKKYHPSTSLGAGKYTNSTDITNNFDKPEKE